MTIQQLMIMRLSFYGDRFECMPEKERVLGGDKGKRSWEKEKERKDVSSVWWPNMSLFIVRVLSVYYLLYLFIYFIKKTILFAIKWINKISFLFSSKPLF